MFQRLHEVRERREGGFTLIELLVVILIIAILAAIAIPVFLNQREKGWESQAQSAVKNAATAAETYATGPGDGDYTGLTPALLETEGFNPIADAPVTVNVSTTGNRYCMEANHVSLSANWHFDSDVGEPAEGNCPVLP